MATTNGAGAKAGYNLDWKASHSSHSISVRLGSCCGYAMHLSDKVIDRECMTTIMITGANSGLGLETSRQLINSGHNLVLCCRTLDKARQTQQLLLSEVPDARIDIIAADLAQRALVRQCIDDLHTPIQILLCVAGAAMLQKSPATDDEIDPTFGSNHLGHFALTLGLLNKYPNDLHRIVIVSSDAHNPAKIRGQFPDPNFQTIEEIAFPDNDCITNWQRAGELRYVHSKLCNVLFAYELARRLTSQDRTDVYVNAFNPGFIPDTNLGRQASTVTKFLMKSVLPKLSAFVPAIRTVKGSATDLINVALTANISGKYFDGAIETRSSDLSYDENIARELWEVSMQLTGINVI
jgi:NAD(P)-dependent dehydrogenase (short-subunit alcohol dehydrogenase family)